MIKAIKKVFATFLCAALLCTNISTRAFAVLSNENDYDSESPETAVSIWAKEEVELARQAGLITAHTSQNFTSSTTRFQFAELISNMTEKIVGMEITPAASETFTDCTETAVLKAYSAGIINGVGNHKFDPAATTNREQIATMLSRAIRYIEAETGKAYAPAAPSVDKFSDKELISDWAIYGVGLLAANSIMNGVTATESGPKEPCTIEQSIILIYRFFVKTNESAPVLETEINNNNNDSNKSDESILQSTKYLVTFKNWDGTTLKTEYIQVGGNAVPPDDPSREGYAFAGWDNDYKNVSADTVVTAKYQQVGIQRFTVIFYDYDRTTILATRTDVPSGGYAEPPSNPAKSGATFIGWNGKYTDVTANTAVNAVYDDDVNVFSTSYTHGKVGETVKVLLSIDGRVSTCGFDIAIIFDEDLELISYDDALDLDIVVNDNAFSNGIKFNYSGASNINKQRDIVELTFRIKDTKKLAIPIWISVTSIYEIADNSPTVTDYNVLDAAVIVER